LECLQLDIKFTKTNKYNKDVAPLKDYRYMANARKQIQFQFDKYTQVFTNKHGFISNLSILDLLFNEGTNALSYLQSQKLDII
jgi:hypothetical protein